MAYLNLKNNFFLNVIKILNSFISYKKKKNNEIDGFGVNATN